MHRAQGRSFTSRAALIAACGALLMDSAAAQPSSGRVAVERLRLASDRSGIVSVEGGRVQDHLVWDAGAWFGWSKDPLIAYRVDDGGRVATLVGNRFGGSLTASVGLWGRGQIACELPLVVSQEQRVSATVRDLSPLADAAIGNVRLVPKLQLLSQPTHGVDVAVVTAFTLPVGSTSSFVGSPEVIFAPEIALSRSFGDARAATAFGVTLRRSRSLENVEFDDEITAQAGVAYRLHRRIGMPLEVQAALAGATSASRPFARINESPAELRGMAAYEFTRSVQLFAGAGVGLTSGWGTPDARAFLGLRGTFAPRPVAMAPPLPVVAVPPPPAAPVPEDAAPPPEVVADADGDHVLDADDACPRDPGPQENRGCPDGDRDNDRVVDRLDDCPDVAGDAAHRGCPKTGVVKLTRDRIEVQGTVYFATDKDAIQPRSFALLDSVAAVIAAHPEIRVRVEGHTDGRGGHAHNMSLSQRRAASVVKYLAGRGVERTRLLAAGFGVTRPVANDATAAGRALNRRVEFHVEAEPSEHAIVGSSTASDSR